MTLNKSSKGENCEAVSYDIEVELEILGSRASQTLSLSVLKENKEWKIYPINILKVVDLLQQPVSVQGGE